MSAERIFESLRTEADLLTLTAEGREEDLLLEFKQKQNDETWRMDEDDRKNFSKALSAFANAAGGVLVFGVRTSSAADGIDRAHSLKSIAGHHQFSGCLQDSVVTTTQPIIEGVRIECIDSATAGRGYVKCLVPQSCRPPHRAMKASNQYWSRTSRGSRQMEHFELEDVFGRRLRPVLVLDLELARLNSDSNVRVLTFRCRNEGRAMARFVGCGRRCERAEFWPVSKC